MWKEIPGYEGYYEISDTGDVRSVERDVCAVDGRIFHYRSKSKQTYVNEDGYKTVKLSKGGIDRRRFVHRLVYEAFVGTIPDGFEVNHKDFNRTNNSVENLEIVTHLDNIRYTLDAGRHISSINNMCGENNPNYGNRTLSRKYAENPELAKIKQGRPGFQNGRCQRVSAKFPDGTVEEFDMVKECAQSLIDRGIAKGTSADVYSRIWKSMKRNMPYKGIEFIYID